MIFSLYWSKFGRFSLYSFFVHVWANPDFFSSKNGKSKQKQSFVEDKDKTTGWHSRRHRAVTRSVANNVGLLVSTVRKIWFIFLQFDIYLLPQSYIIVWKYSNHYHLVRCEFKILITYFNFTNVGLWLNGLAIWYSDGC